MVMLSSLRTEIAKDISLSASHLADICVAIEEYHKLDKSLQEEETLARLEKLAQFELSNIKFSSRLLTE